jgi:hypothetical protein
MAQLGISRSLLSSSTLLGSYFAFESRSLRVTAPIILEMPSTPSKADPIRSISLGSYQFSTIRAYSWKLTDKKVAALTTYVRNAWGKVVPQVYPSQVSKLRPQLKVTN